MKTVGKVFFLLGLISFFITHMYGQNISNSNLFCEQEYNIIGPKGIRLDKSAEYKVVISGTDQILDSNQIEFSISYKNRNILSLKGNKFEHLFKEDGEYTLRAVFEDENKCYYDIQKNIKTYGKSIVYIGDNIKEFEIGFQDNFEKHKILLNQIIIDSKKVIGEENIVSKLTENTLAIKNSDIIVINSRFFDQILDGLGKINNGQDLELRKKEIFILNDLNQNFLKRILAKYIKILGISTMYVVDNDYTLTLFSNLSFDNDISLDQYVKTFSLSFSQVPKYFLLSYLVDNMIYNGFPINLIGLFFSLSLVALIVSFFRQVVGFSVFGIYSPILFATSMAVFGFRFSLILFSIATIAVLLSRFFNKKIYLLYSAKLSILLILYFLIMLITLGLDKILNINMINFSVFNNGLVIFPIIFLVIVAEKVFYEGFKVKSKSRILSFLEFMIVSAVVYGILSWDVLKQFLLSYPEIILIIFLLNIFVGRFTGLQLLEYIRFIPLLEKESENEIEEE